MLLYIFSHKFFKCVFFLLYQSIYKSKSITCLSYKDSKSVYIFLGHPVYAIYSFTYLVFNMHF